MSTETTAIMVPKIRDGNGQPTCRYWDEICPFMMYFSFSTREHCFWPDDTGRYRPELERRHDQRGPFLGPTIPHKNCPVWAANQPTEEQP